MPKTSGPGKKKESRAEARARQAKVVEELLQKFEGQLKGKEGKATLGDYLKLVQLRQELEDAEPREIRVTWVEPEATTESDSEE